MFDLIEHIDDAAAIIPNLIEPRAVMAAILAPRSVRAAHKTVKDIILGLPPFGLLEAALKQSEGR